MSDRIAILKRNGCYIISFCIDGRWWPITDHHCRLATWPNAVQARAYLGAAADRYKRTYCEDLGWDVEHIPVLELEGKLA